MRDMADARRAVPAGRLAAGLRSRARATSRRRRRSSGRSRPRSREPAQQQRLIDTMDAYRRRRRSACSSWPDRRSRRRGSMIRGSLVPAAPRARRHGLAVPHRQQPRPGRGGRSEPRHLRSGRPRDPAARRSPCSLVTADRRRLDRRRRTAARSRKSTASARSCGRCRGGRCASRKTCSDRSRGSCTTTSDRSSRRSARCSAAPGATCRGAEARRSPTSSMSVRGVAQQALDRIRTQSQWLHPGVLDDFGLVKVARAFRRRSSSARPASAPACRRPAPFDAIGEEYAIHVYRIAQEALEQHQPPFRLQPTRGFASPATRRRARARGRGSRQGHAGRADGAGHRAAWASSACASAPS